MCGDDCLPTGEDLFSFGSNGILPNLLLLAVQGVVYFAIILLLENPKIKNRISISGKLAICIKFLKLGQDKGSSNKMYGFHNPYTVRI